MAEWQNDEALPEWSHRAALPPRPRGSSVPPLALPPPAPANVAAEAAAAVDVYAEDGGEYVYEDAPVAEQDGEAGAPLPPPPGDEGAYAYEDALVAADDADAPPPAAADVAYVYEDAAAVDYSTLPDYGDAAAAEPASFAPPAAAAAFAPEFREGQGAPAFAVLDSEGRVRATVGPDGAVRDALGYLAGFLELEGDDPGAADPAEELVGYVKRGRCCCCCCCCFSSATTTTDCTHPASPLRYARTTDWYVDVMAVDKAGGGDDKVLANLDLGTGSLKDLGGGTMAEVSRTGDVTNNAGMRVGAIEGFDFDKIKIVALCVRFPRAALSPLPRLTPPLPPLPPSSLPGTCSSSTGPSWTTCPSRGAPPTRSPARPSTASRCCWCWTRGGRSSAGSRATASTGAR